MDGTDSTKVGTGDRYTPGLPLLSPMDGLAPPKRDESGSIPDGSAARMEQRWLASLISWKSACSIRALATPTTFGTSALSYGAARAFDSLRRHRSPVV